MNEADFSIINFAKYAAKQPPCASYLTTGGVFLEIISFDELYEAQSPMVYWTAFGMSNNHDTALEITQSVFLKALEHWEIVRKLKLPQAKGWLYKATRNLIVDRVRKYKRELIAESPPDVMDTDTRVLPETAYLQQEEHRAVFEAVQSLPKQYREPILLHYFAHLTQEEAAAMLGLTGGTYRSRLCRGRDRLERTLCKKEAWHDHIYEG